MNTRSINGPPTTLPQYQEDLHPVSPVPFNRPRWAAGAEFYRQ